MGAATLVQDLTIELPANSKDHIIPYCADQRHPMDTLFFIAEEDWRLAQSHAAPGVDLTGLTDDLHMALETPESLLELEAVRGENRSFPRWQIPKELTADDQADPPADGEWIDEGLRFHRRATKPSKGEFTTTTRWLVDMIKICTEASRAGASDLLWMSWLPKASKRVKYPTRYTGLIALTAEGARKIMLNWDEWFPEPTHWDIALRKALSEKPAVRAELSAGYVYPGIGLFCDHPSSNSKSGEVRQADWTSHHFIQDTRTSKLTAGHHSIAVCAFCRSGPQAFLHPGLTLPDVGPDEDFRWWTAAITVTSEPEGAVPTAVTKNLVELASPPKASGCPRTCTCGAA